MSASRGMLVSRKGSSVSRLAAISLMAEFLAPLIGISPFSRAPPVMAMRSNRYPSKYGQAAFRCGTRSGVSSLPVPRSPSGQSEGSFRGFCTGGAAVADFRRRRLALSARASLASREVAAALRSLSGSAMP